ncbi:hypothetical protein [Eshraghiella crossota]|uniref:hypothetical protein n=1 Tax=Eshraghiella crossota TaxID=45851 RepID=UPI004026C0E3
MKLKYYLRGLGVGIVVTAVILTIANHLGNKMSDEDIIKRAAKLGMVMKEDESLFPPTEPETTTPEPTSPSPTEQDTTAVKPAEPETTTSEPTTPVPTEPETTTPVPAEPQTSGVVIHTATITVTSGMYSEAVSQRLEEAGIVKNWREFNEYLTSNGYAERLQTGTHSFNSEMDFNEIAEILVSR